MTASERPIIETRHDQMFPVLEPAEIDRVRRFGETRSYRAGERLATTGEVGPGMFVILAGNVVVTQRDALAHHPPIVTYGPGSFLGELAQLSGRPALVDAHTQGTVEALVIPPHRLRDVLVEEAELGERIMRALILRRVGLTLPLLAPPQKNRSRPSDSDPENAHSGRHPERLQNFSCSRGASLRPM